jgi:hypothetical protein
MHLQMSEDKADDAVPAKQQMRPVQPHVTSESGGGKQGVEQSSSKSGPSVKSDETHARVVCEATECSHGAGQPSVEADATATGNKLKLASFMPASLMHGVECLVCETKDGPESGTQCAPQGPQTDVPQSSYRASSLPKHTPHSRTAKVSIVRHKVPAGTEERMAGLARVGAAVSDSHKPAREVMREPGMALLLHSSWMTCPAGAALDDHCNPPPEDRHTRASEGDAAGMETHSLSHEGSSDGSGAESTYR